MNYGHLMNYGQYELFILWTVGIMYLGHTTMCGGHYNKLRILSAMGIVNNVDKKYELSVL